MSNPEIYKVLAEPPTELTDLEDLRAEAEKLRKALGEQKPILDQATEDSQKVNDFVTTMNRVLKTISMLKKLPIEQLEGDQELPFNDVLNIFQNGVEKFFNIHKSMTSSYELHFQKSVFQIEEQLSAAEKKLEEKKKESSDMKVAAEHSKSLSTYSRQDKQRICRTYLIKNSNYLMKARLNRSQLEKTQNSLDFTKQNLLSMQEKYTKTKNDTDTLFHNALKKVQSESDLFNDLSEKARNRENLRNKLRLMTFENSVLFSKIDRAKEELEQESLRASAVIASENAKNVLAVEQENIRISNIMKIESNQINKQIQIEKDQITSLEKSIQQQQAINADLVKRIEYLQQKIKVVMAKAPDISQILLSIDQKVNDLNKEQTSLTRRTRELDELRQLNPVPQWQIDESKQRMANLKMSMPMYGTFEEYEAKIDFEKIDVDKKGAEIAIMGEHLSQFSLGN